MVEPTAAHTRDLSDYISLVRRRWAWVVGCIVAGLLVGLVQLATAQPTYVSRAKVLVEATGPATPMVGARTVDDAINLDTEAQLVTSEPVAARAVEMLQSPLSPPRLASRVTVTVPPNTTVLEIAFRARSAEEAQAGAQTFARAYLENRDEVAQQKLDADIERLRGQIEETTAAIQDANVALAGVTGANQDSDRAFLLARRQALSNQLASFNAELAPLVGTTVDGGDVIVDAARPGRPADPNPMVILPAALMVGLVVGLALAAWRERTDKRVHSGADLERLFGVAPLLRLKAVGRGVSARVDRDVRAFYHSLRADGPEDGEVAVLVGPDASDTAEHLAYSLALVAARTGASTSYVTRPGSPVLLDRRRTETSGLHLPDYEALGVLVEGEVRPSRLRAAVAELIGKRDLVILGLPNDDPAVDLPLLGRHADVAVVVVRLGVSRRDTVGAVLNDLTKAGVDRVVAVTVDLGRRRLRKGAVPAGDVFTDSAVRRPRRLESDPDSSERRRRGFGTQNP